MAGYKLIFTFTFTFTLHQYVCGVCSEDKSFTLENTFNIKKD
jgi:hypothetical protein